LNLAALSGKPRGDKREGGKKPAGKAKTDGPGPGSEMLKEAGKETLQKGRNGFLQSLRLQWGELNRGREVGKQKVEWGAGDTQQGSERSQNPREQKNGRVGGGKGQGKV